MIRIIADEDGGSHAVFGEPADSPFRIIEDASSRLDAVPHIVYAQDPVYPQQGNGWIVVGAYPDPASKDEGGWEALRLGSWYYHRGMSCRDPHEKETRIECFRAAEILYLHAAKLGNTFALINLGYVYSYDRCNGRYWPGWERYDAGDFSGYPADERAYQVLLQACEEDFAEAHYKLGDLYSSGKGCEQDHAAAFECYRKAYSLSRFDDAVISGSCAFRLAKAFEEGRGCEQSFKMALHYYQEAQDALERAVDSGESYYRKALSRARSGVIRMRQEISGRY